ncbi:MAG: pilus assembly protein PilM [Planctomycetes bacterium]|nr:pilus assembly protein PilM [Planctomycetota bacterium]
MRKRDVLCIDWDGRSIRVLEVGFHRSGVVVRRAVHAPVPPDMDVRDPATMGDFLRRTLGEHRIRTRRAIVDVPRHDTFLNRLSLPSGTMDELAAMVHLQIPKELPFSRDQAVIDFVVVPNEGTTWDVWVAAIRVGVVEYYRQVFAAAGLTLERIGLRPYANVRTLQASDLTRGRVVMVEIGPSMTEINILRDGQLMYTRAAPVAMPAAGSPAIGAEGEAAGPPPPMPMDDLLIEVSRTIAAYRATDLGATIDLIVLAGTVWIDEPLARAFEERFTVPTQVQPVPRAVRWRAELAGSPAPFSAAMGLALGELGEASHRFDFLHVKEPEAEHRQRAKRRPVVAATVLMFAAAGVVAAYQPIRHRNLELAALEASYAVQNSNEKSRQEALKRVTDLGDWQARDVIWINHLHRIAEVFPSNKECFITRLDVNAAKGTITLTLAAANGFVAAKVVEAVKSITDEKDRPLFDAVSGNKAGEAKIADYPVSDEVTITVLSLAPKQKKR